MRRVIGIGLTIMRLQLGGGSPVFGVAEPPLSCIVCGHSPLTGVVWKHPAGLFCNDCAQIEQRCWLCNLPIREGFARTGDGRFICRLDVPRTVLRPEEARQLFDQMVADVRELCGPGLALRQTNVAVNLFDVDYWNYQDGKPVPSDLRRTGFSSTRRDGNEISHTVVLLSGQYRGDLVSVAAHEYAHLWLHENRPETKPLAFETTEAICELIAHKLASHRGDTARVAHIEKNPYTRGHIRVLIELERQRGLPAILDWVKNGGSPQLTAESLNQMATDQAWATWRAASGPSTAPNTLVLRAVTGTPRKRLALINDQTVGPLEEAQVRVGDKRVRIKCLEIGDRFARVQVHGAAEPVRLELR